MNKRCVPLAFIPEETAPRGPRRGVAPIPFLMTHSFAPAGHYDTEAAARIALGKCVGRLVTNGASIDNAVVRGAGGRYYFLVSYHSASEMLVYPCPEEYAYCELAAADLAGILAAISSVRRFCYGTVTIGPGGFRCEILYSGPELAPVELCCGAAA